MVEQSDIIKFISPLIEQEFYLCQQRLDESLAYLHGDLISKGLSRSSANIKGTQKEYEKDIEARQVVILSIVKDALNTVEGELSKRTVQDLTGFAREQLSSHIHELEKKLRKCVSRISFKQFDSLELGADRALSAFDAKLEILLRTPVSRNSASSVDPSFVETKQPELRSVASINNAVTARETPTPTPLSTSAGMHRIFLCHASEDKPQVREVYQRLKAEGFQPWLDEENLLPGQEWDREIRRALRESEFILIFFSQNSVAKRGYVQREMKLALDAWEEVPEGQIHTIPVRLDDCEIPERFKKFQWADLFNERNFERMIRAIHADLSQQQQNSPKSVDEVFPTSDLIFKVEEVRVAHKGGPQGMIPSLYTCIRVTNRGQRDRSIITFQISEMGGPSWKLSERPFSVDGDPLNQPIKVPRDDARFICIRAESEVTYDELPSSVGRLKLNVQDHLDELYELWLTEGSTKPI